MAAHVGDGPIGSQNPAGRWAEQWSPGAGHTGEPEKAELGRGGRRLKVLSPGPGKKQVKKGTSGKKEKVLFSLGVMRLLSQIFF